LKICYIEDELDLRNIINKYLQKEGYEIINYASGEDFINDNNFDYDLFILDIMLKGKITGYDLIKIIQENTTSRIIFTSARNQDIDKIMGLELGGDDYLAKPFSPRELVLRVKNLLKRDNIINKPITPKNIVKYQDYEIDLDKRTVTENKKEIELSSKEFDCLCFFLNNIGISFTRENILTELWGENYFGSDRVVDDLIRRVRSKLKQLRLETIYGYGYRLL
jgi:two-component system response regulator CssR